MRHGGMKEMRQERGVSDGIFGTQVRMIKNDHVGSGGRGTRTILLDVTTHNGIDAVSNVDMGDLLQLLQQKRRVSVFRHTGVVRIQARGHESHTAALSCHQYTRQVVGIRKVTVPERQIHAFLRVAVVDRLLSWRIIIVIVLRGHE